MDLLVKCFDTVLESVEHLDADLYYQLVLMRYDVLFVRPDVVLALQHWLRTNRNDLRLQHAALFFAGPYAHLQRQVWLRIPSLRADLWQLANELLNKQGVGSNI